MVDHSNALNGYPESAGKLTQPACRSCLRAGCGVHRIHAGIAGLSVSARDAKSAHLVPDSTICDLLAMKQGWQLSPHRLMSSTADSCAKLNADATATMLLRRAYRTLSAAFASKDRWAVRLRQARTGRCKRMPSADRFMPSQVMNGQDVCGWKPGRTLRLLVSQPLHNVCSKTEASGVKLMECVDEKTLRAY